MLVNAKNNQFDTEEIRSSIKQTIGGLYSRNRDFTNSDKDSKALIGVDIPIGMIATKAYPTESSQSKWDKFGVFSDIQIEFQKIMSMNPSEITDDTGEFSSIPEPEHISVLFIEAGIGITIPNMLPEEDDRRIRPLTQLLYDTGLEKAQKLGITLSKSQNDLAYRGWGGFGGDGVFGNLTDLELSALVEVEQLAEDIENLLNRDIADDDIRYRLNLLAADNPERLRAHNENFISELLTVIRKAKIRFFEQYSLSGNLMKNYLESKNISALNIIKLIKKGTDNAANYYTGDCFGIVLEALSIRTKKKENFFQPNMMVHKNIIYTHENPNIKNTTMEVFYGIDIIAYHPYDCGMYLLVIEPEQLEPGKNSRKDSGTEDYRDEMEIMKQLRNKANNFLRLYIPRTMDLSNSFKAKYI